MQGEGKYASVNFCLSILPFTYLFVYERVYITYLS